MKRVSLRKLWGVLMLAAVLLATLAGCKLLEGFAPPAPTGLTATSGSLVGRIRLTWEPVPEAAGYEVWRSSSSAGEYTRLDLTALPAYDDSTVKPGATYWYKVRACSRSGCSPFAGPVSGWARISAAPEAPRGLIASQGEFEDVIELSWQASQGADSYEIYRAVSSQTAPFALIAEVAATSYEDRDVTGGKIYWYKVRACSTGFGCSVLSAAVSGYAEGAGLEAPQNVTASDGTEDGKVVVSWDEVEGATSYKVYRADSEDGDYEEKAEVEATTWEDTSAELSVTYWYKVQACNDSGCSDLSEADSGYWGPPSPPGG